MPTEMSVVGKLEEILLKTRLPARVIAAASAAAVAAPAYAIGAYAENVPFDLPPWTFAATIAFSTYCFLSPRLSTTITLQRELGIRINDARKKISSRRPKKAWQSLWDSWLLHPKASAAVIATGAVAARSGFLDLQKFREVFSVEGYAQPQAALHVLAPAVIYAAEIGLFSFLFYHAVRYLSWFVSTESASLSIDMIRANFAKRDINGKLEGLVRKYPSRTMCLDVAVEAFRGHDIELAAKYVLRAAELPDVNPFPNVKLEDFVRTHVSTVYGHWRKSRRDIVMGLELATYVKEFGSSSLSDSIVRQAADANGSAEANALAAWWTQKVFGRKDAARHYWAESTMRLHAGNGYKIELVGEGVNEVYQMGLPFMKALVINKMQDRVATEFESGMIGFVDRIQKNPRYIVAEELAVVPLDDSKYVLVLAFLKGDTMLDLTRNGVLTAEQLFMVTDYLALLHAEIPTGMSKIGEVGIKEKAEREIRNPHLGLAPEFQESLLHHVEFMLEEETGPLVFHQDAHRAQFLYSGENVAKLDYGDKGLSTIYRDLAKLHLHPDIPLDTENFQEIQRQTFRIFLDRKLATGEEVFMRRHLQYMLLQGLAFYPSAWSSPGMRHMKAQRGQAVAASAKVFDILRQDHWQHYRSNRAAYAALQDDFAQLEEKFSAEVN